MRCSGLDSKFKTGQMIKVEGGMVFGSNCRSAAERMARLLKLAGMLARTVPRHNLPKLQYLPPPARPSFYPSIYFRLKHYLISNRTTSKP